MSGGVALSVGLRSARELGGGGKARLSGGAKALDQELFWGLAMCLSARWRSGVRRVAFASGGRGLNEWPGCCSTYRRDLIYLDDLHEGRDGCGIELCPGAAAEFGERRVDGIAGR